MTFFWIMYYIQLAGARNYTYVLTSCRAGFPEILSKRASYIIHYTMAKKLKVTCSVRYRISVYYGSGKSESESVSHSVMSNSLWTRGLYSLPAFSVYGILQARILEWVAIPFFRESSWPRDWNRDSALQVGSFPSELPKKPWQWSRTF